MELDVIIGQLESCTKQGEFFTPGWACLYAAQCETVTHIWEGLQWNWSNSCPFLWEILHRQMLSRSNLAFTQYSRKLFFPLNHRNLRIGTAAWRHSWLCSCSSAMLLCTFLGLQWQNIRGGFCKMRNCKPAAYFQTANNKASIQNRKESVSQCKSLQWSGTQTKHKSDAGHMGRLIQEQTF